MENFLSENFKVKPKSSSEEVLQRWRNLREVVKNPKRRFRFAVENPKAAAMQEKIRIGFLVYMASVRYIDILDEVEKESSVPLLGLREGEDLQGVAPGLTVLDECDEVEEESLDPLQGSGGRGDSQDATVGSTCSVEAQSLVPLGGLREGEGLQGANTGLTVSAAGCSRQMENPSMNVGDEIREESLVIRHSHSNSMGSRDIYPLHPARSDQVSFNTSPPCHSFFKIFIPSSLVLVAVKCQFKSLDPFVTYPQQTWSFIVAIFAYCLILWALKQSQNRSAEFRQFLSRLSLASGVLSSLSLVSLFLPHIPRLLLLYASWALSTIISALPIFQCTCNWLFTRFEVQLDVLISPARKLFRGRNFMQQQPPLPVRGLPV